MAKIQANKMLDALRSLMVDEVGERLKKAKQRIEELDESIKQSPDTKPEKAQSQTNGTTTH